jgi:hypothetical protein
MQYGLPGRFPDIDDHTLFVPIRVLPEKVESGLPAVSAEPVSEKAPLHVSVSRRFDMDDLRPPGTHEHAGQGHGCDTPDLDSLDS